MRRARRVASLGEVDQRESGRHSEHRSELVTDRVNS